MTPLPISGPRRDDSRFRAVKTRARPLPAALYPALCLAAMMLLGPGLVAAVAEARAASGFGVRLISSRPGHLFTDSDRLEVRVQVCGADGAEETVSIEYAVEESAGPWKDQGRLALPATEDGSGESLLPLKLPGRGLYHLTVKARCGEARAGAETWVAVVFTPPPPSADSPWGIFYTPPLWFDKANPEGSRHAAIQHRLLGASWTRLNFWAHSFETVTVSRGAKLSVTAEYPTWRQYVRDLRKEGICIFGEIAQCPRELSSRPDARQEAGDAGPEFNRVRPRDYVLWDALMEQLAADFRDDIQVWEIWNEANLKDRYWTGTAEEFAELVEHTSGALRRGNPKARIAAAGFTNGVGDGFADRLLTLGMGRHIDIFSVHYTDQNPGSLDDWRKLLAKHRLALPIWNSEEKSEVPIRNLAGSVERSFKFIHVDVGYPEYRPLVRKDWTVLPAGMLFSVGAHCLGNGKPVGHSDKVKGYEVQFFRRGEETVGVFDPEQLTGDVRLFGATASQVTLLAERLAPSVPGTDPDNPGPRVTDSRGRSRPLAIENGRATIPLAGGILFINGCGKLEVLSAETGLPASEACAFEAESGRFSQGFRVSDRATFSGGKTLDIWTGDDPGSDGYWVELKIVVPHTGTYEILFSGNALSRLMPPRSLSPFTWRIDGGGEREANGTLAILSGITGAPEGLSVLGTMPLSQGEHTFRLTLRGRRDEPDKNYALWFDAIGLRRTDAPPGKTADSARP